MKFGDVPVMAGEPGKAKRRSAMWLSFQECMLCLETLLRSSAQSIEARKCRISSLR